MGEGEKSSLPFRFHLSPFPQKRLILRPVSCEKMGTVSTYSDPSTDRAVGSVGENQFVFSYPGLLKGKNPETRSGKLNSGTNEILVIVCTQANSHLVDPTILPFTVGMFVYVVDV